jgi:hypothetical protein
MTRFVPEGLTIPVGMETDEFRIRMLTVNDVVKDYDAVMSSVGHLRGVFGPGSSWPAADLSLEQDLIDLGWHQKEFQLGRAFAYTVVSRDESRCLGCVYVDPSEKVGYDARIVLWVRASELTRGLDQRLFVAVRDWLTEFWWFDSVAYPGRDISWQEWAALSEK